jgi:hypothetical protein
MKLATNFPRFSGAILLTEIRKFFEHIVHDKKENEIFLICKEIQMGSVAKPYIRKGFLINKEMRKYLTIHEEAVSHI